MVVVVVVVVVVDDISGTCVLVKFEAINNGRVVVGGFPVESSSGRAVGVVVEVVVVCGGGVVFVLLGVASP